MYSDPEKLAKLLGIEQLPAFTREEFKAPFEDNIVDSVKQEALLSNVRKYSPSATLEELKTVLDLVAIGMHYVQHKTKEDVNRKMWIVDKIINAHGASTNTICFISKDEYVMTYGWLANFIDKLKLSDELDIKVPHKPTMGVNTGMAIIIAGAEEAHHAITYKQHSECYDVNYVRGPDYIGYFKDPLELAFGEFIPKLISDFGCDVKQMSVYLDSERGDLADEEYGKLYRERLEQRYGFKLPTDEEVKAHR